MTIFRSFAADERVGLTAHGLDTRGPSQLSDAFVQGMRYAKEQAAVMEAAPAVPAAGVVEATFNDGWQNFICYLIDHAEGELVTEEALQLWAARFLQEPRYVSARSTPATVVQAASEGLHAALMNLPCNSPYPAGTGGDNCYRVGHRDARHAAAELVSAALSAAPGSDGVETGEGRQG